MTKFVLTRFASMIAVILVLSFVMFVLQQVTPVDPVRSKLGASG